MRGSVGRNRSRKSSTGTSETLTIHPTMTLLGLTATNASPTRTRSTTAKRAPTSRAVAASAFMIVCTTRRLLVDLADRDPSARQLGPRGVGVDDHRQQTLLRSGSHLRDALADHD